MNIYLAATGALPALLAMAYFDHLDRKRPEPPNTLRRVAFLGALSAIPCVIVELLLTSVSPNLSPIPAALFKAFVVYAIVEEIAKVVTVRLGVWNRPEFDERMDGIVYGTRAGLGFALLENVLYLAGTTTVKEFVVLFVIRGCFSVPMHAVAGGLSGYFGALRRFDGRGPGFAGGLALAVLVHGSFDGGILVASGIFATSPLVALALWWGAVLMIIPMGLWLRSLAKKAIAADDAALPNPAP